MADHIPPVTIYGSTFQMELKHDLLPDGTASESPSNFKAKLPPELPDDQYGKIEVVHVVTEFDDPQAFMDRMEIKLINLLRVGNPTLHLWLDGEGAPPKEEEEREGHIQIRGFVETAGRKTLQLSSVLPLTEKRPTPHTRRPANYALTNGRNSNLWIRKWAIVGQDGRRVDGGEITDPGPVGFQFMLIFSHVDHQTADQSGKYEAKIQ